MNHKHLGLYIFLLMKYIYPLPNITQGTDRHHLEFISNCHIGWNYCLKRISKIILLENSLERGNKKWMNEWIKKQYIIHIIFKGIGSKCQNMNNKMHTFVLSLIIYKSAVNEGFGSTTSKFIKWFQMHR